MSAGGPAIWVVASPPTVGRWAGAVEAAGELAIPLPWSVVGQAESPENLVRDLGPVEPGSAAQELILFTSPQAPEALPPGSGPGRRCACVGARTASAARLRGFEVVLVGEAGGAELGRRLLAARPPAKRVLFLRGREAASACADLLVEAGVVVREKIVYTVDLDPAFAVRLQDAPPPAVIILGSPRAAAAVATLAGVLGETVRFVAPGAATGAAAEAVWTGRVHRATQPEPGAIVQAVRGALEERERKRT